MCPLAIDVDNRRLSCAMMTFGEYDGHHIHDFRSSQNLLNWSIVKRPESLANLAIDDAA